MRNLTAIITGIMLIIPCVLSAYKIDIIYRSVHTYKTLETAYRSESHIKEINLSPRLWKSVDGKEKEAKLLELIGPNKVVLEMENPIVRGLNTEFTIDASQLAEDEQKYIRDLYHRLKFEYFEDYAKQQVGRWKGELASLEAQKKRIDEDMRAVQKQKEAVLSSTTVNVNVLVDITNNYNFGGYSGSSSSSYWSASSSTSSSQKSTKKFDDLISRLEHKKRDLPRLIQVSKDAIRVSIGVYEKAKADKASYEKARSSEVDASSNDSQDLVKKRLKELKELHESGLISQEVYEQKQREILEGK
jgi:hypothetical protein